MSFQDTMLNASKSVGNFLTTTTQKVLEFISDKGFVTNKWTAMCLSALIVAIVAYIIVHFAQGIKPIIKYIIILLSILTIVSIIIASFT